MRAMISLLFFLSPFAQAATTQINGDWVLVQQKTIKAPAGDLDLVDQANQAVTVLSDTFPVQNGDVLVVKGQMEITDNRTDGSVGRGTAYIACGGSRVTPFSSKDLVRYKGNHHGGLELDGFCRATGAVRSLAVSLVLKTTSPDFTVNQGDLTSLSVELYRPATSSTGQRVVKALSADNDRISVAVGIGAPFVDTSLLSLSADGNAAGDTLYASGFGSAEVLPNNPNLIDMFGLKILLGNKRLSVRTENTTLENHRVTQTILGWQALDANNLTATLSLLAYGANGNGLWVDKNYSSLAAMIFSAREGGLALNKIIRNYPDQSVVLAGNGSSATTGTGAFALNGPAVVRAVAAAGGDYGPSSAGSLGCSLAFEVWKDGFFQESSPLVHRFVGPTYKAMNLRNEQIFSLQGPGQFEIRSRAHCGGGADAVTLSPANTWLNLDVFGQ